jgi:hypothetical protein
MYQSIVRVSGVELIEPNYKIPKPFDSKGNLFDSINGWKGKGSVLAFYQNSQINYRSQAPFLNAFVQAYNNHGDIVLSPDDVWFQILSQVSKYIDSNAEALRSKFVSHDGKKFLSVTTPLGVGEERWQEFFVLMKEELRSNTVPGVVDALESKFSTTGLVESMLSVGTIMSGFAKYFDYGRCIPMCGIRHVMFMGTLDDWVGLKSKLLGLKQFVGTPGDFLDRYIEGLEPILDKFISTYSGNEEREFWDKIMNITHGSLGSGTTSYISGWILKFYGLKGRVEMCDINNEFINVPIKLDNKETGIKKMVNLYGGFGGISRTKDELYDVYRPQQSFIIYHDGSILEE